MSHCQTKSSEHPAAAGLSPPVGRRHWRSLEELAGSPEIQEFLEREFPHQAGQWNDPVTRRQFLTLMGASLALSGLAGCSQQQAPVEKIMPYARQPEQMVLGKPMFFATAMTLGGGATGLLVKSHEGRPTKIEGNPDHPASLGASDPFAQAAILGLYDPDRSQSVTHHGMPSSWSAAQLALRMALEKLRPNQGRGLRILTETVTSPALADQLMGRGSSLVQAFPQARWYQYEPAHSSGAQQGSQLVFGEMVQPIYDFSAADVVLSLDADFLNSGSAHVRYARDFMARRRSAVQQTKNQAMNRLYVVECCPSVTGSVADHRLPMRASDVEKFARALAAELSIGLPSSASAVGDQQTMSEPVRRWIAAVAKDLTAHRGASLVIAGAGQPAKVHALAQAMNNTLENTGTVKYISPVEAKPTNQTEDLTTLVREMEAGEVEMLLVLSGNPVFNAPADLEFAKHLPSVPVYAHLGLYQDETAALCEWHIPQSHFLEAWGDARAYDGTASIQQPLIAPLYNGLSAHEVLSGLFDVAQRSGYEIVRSYWRENWPPAGGGENFDSRWEKALHDGLIAGTAYQARTNLRLRPNWTADLPRTAGVAEEVAAGSESLEIIFQPDPTIYDGRFANNGWLQELPKPITKLTWDNAAFVSPKTAEKLGLTQTFGASGGEHGQAIVDLVELEVDGRTVQAPAWILPGHADDSITVHLGYGRFAAGKVGNGVGFNAYRLRTSVAPWFAGSAKIRKLDETYTLACTQMHHSMQGRDPVRAVAYEQFQKNPLTLDENEDEEHRRFQRELVPTPGGEPHAEDSNQSAPHDRAGSQSTPQANPLTLFPGYDYSPPKNKWGMVIDLTSCIGCNACVAACQAENNIPIVGKTEVTRGREMHWIRVDRYYTGEAENPDTYFQPVPCMQCENAPCELVCPVGATVHSAEGLNDMVYNRCVGTRYCSNNCPYKVRRFNFLEYGDFTTESLKLGRNPNVTVRSRGVMEKCTYCVQRIRAAQIDSEKSGQPIRDGELQTACQAACPAQAIVFGDMNDSSSRVAALKGEPLHYGLLAELNTRPRTTYLAAVRNPNPELAES
ncbi:MAG TPA: TAT-variant-translocated molybdopterin oxidoreductase [Pirellulales bacterium]|jgi:molybdopterin-containing oxidoreductase family iron-sulfur binding subunit|nr:TAT-variant-translocated molybdopterin oxidoreductase [Pirellulales bacterium]